MKYKVDSIITSPYPSLNKANLEILFGHKKEISRNFSDVLGLHLINHIAIYLVNQTNELTIISSTPSVEFNLIENKLWLYDGAFNPKHLPNLHVGTWQALYSHLHFKQLMEQKETHHGFTYGLNLVRHLKEYTILYSFATRSLLNNIVDYYQGIQEELLQIGDYAYNLNNHIYSIYNRNCTPPILETPLTNIKRKPYLKLVNARPLHSQHK
jgi:hypothetical protein